MGTESSGAEEFHVRNNYKGKEGLVKKESCAVLGVSKFIGPPPGTVCPSAR